MRNLLRAIARVVAASIDLRDIFTFAGLAMLANGLHAIYPPAAWIALGAALFWIGNR